MSTEWRNGSSSQQRVMLRGSNMLLGILGLLALSQVGSSDPVAFTGTVDVNGGYTVAFSRWHDTLLFNNIETSVGVQYNVFSGEFSLPRRHGGIYWVTARVVPDYPHGEINLCVRVNRKCKLEVFTKDHIPGEVSAALKLRARHTVKVTISKENSITNQTLFSLVRIPGANKAITMKLKDSTTAPWLWGPLNKINWNEIVTNNGINVERDFENVILTVHERGFYIFSMRADFEPLEPHPLEMVMTINADTYNELRLYSDGDGAASASVGYYLDHVIVYVAITGIASTCRGCMFSLVQIHNASREEMRQDSTSGFYGKAIFVSANAQFLSFNTDGGWYGLDYSRLTGLLSGIVNPGIYLACLSVGAHEGEGDTGSIFDFVVNGRPQRMLSFITKEATTNLCATIYLPRNSNFAVSIVLRRGAVDSASRFSLTLVEEFEMPEESEGRLYR